MIYLDNNATTQIAPLVLEAMMPFLTEKYGNAASNHEFGIRVNNEVKRSRKTISSLIGADPNEIIFTSGATEAINLGIKGLIAKNPERNHIITVQTEHKAVLDVCAFLESKGVNVTYLPVSNNGIIDVNQLIAALTDRTLLVCAMIANNETGVIHPIKEISKIAHDNGSFFMTDATQAYGKIPIDVQELGIDIMTFSGHKIYGPKGIGALYVSNRRPFNPKLESIIHGGGHERQMRSGTLNVPGIIGLGKASEIAKDNMQRDQEKISSLRDYLETELLKIPDTSINGDKDLRLYNTCNICFHGADADAIMMGLDEIIVSNGSACTSTEINPSHVLIALGRSEKDAYSSLRISLSRYTTLEEIKETIKQITRVVGDLRVMSMN